MAANQQIRLIRLPDVMAVTGLKRGTIYKQMNEGTFPKPISLGARAVAWPEHIIQEWIVERIAAAQQQ